MVEHSGESAPTVLVWRFPTKVINAIVAHLQGNERALRSCALVGKAWLFPTRNHLWRLTRVRCTSHHIQALNSLLDTAPCLSNIVHSLIVSQTYIQSMIQDAHTLFNPLLGLIARFSSLCELSLCALRIRDWRYILEQSDPWTIVSPSLRHLIIQGCSFYSFYYIPRLHYAFPNLDHLSLNQLTWNVDTPNLASLPGFGINSKPYPPLNMHHLELGILEKGELVPWMLKSGSPLSISSLSLRHLRPNDFPLHDLLRNLGSSLQHISICTPSFVEFRAGEPREALDKYLDLSANDSVETISIDIKQRYTDVVGKWIRTILLQLPSNNVREVTFPIRENGYHIYAPTLGNVGWRGIAEFLMDQPKFSELRKVTLSIPRDTPQKDKAEVEVKLSPHFMLLQTRGIEYGITLYDNPAPPMVNDAEDASSSSMVTSDDDEDNNDESRFLSVE